MSGSLDNAEYSKLQTFARDFVDEFSDDGLNFDDEKGLKMSVLGFSSQIQKFTNDPMLSDTYLTIANAIDKDRMKGGTNTEDCFNNAAFAMDKATSTVSIT